MNVLKNRHVLVAALVAPVLALIAYFAVDHFFGEKPHAAVEGGSYALVEKPNCRWASGQCGLKNNEFELTLSFERLSNGHLLLQLESVYPLQGAVLAVALNEREVQPPRAMRPDGPEGLRWALEMPVTRPGEERIRLAVTANGVDYFGEVSTAFAGTAED